MMKQQQMQLQDRKRLSDVAPATNYTPMEQVSNRDLLLTSAIPSETNFGPGYKLTVKELDTDEEHTLLTSAMVVCKQLDKALQAEGPFEDFVVKFEKAG